MKSKKPESGPDDTTLRIYLIRHARPMVERKGWRSHKQATEYILAYDLADVETVLPYTETEPLHKVKRVYCSTLVRSRQTAAFLFHKKVTLIPDSNFREFERKIFKIPFLKLPLNIWLIKARLLWMLGFNSKGIESFREARKRARLGAQTLINEAEENKTAVLVAHGLLNKYLELYFRRRGWHLVSSGGNRFVGVTLLEKRKVKPSLE